MGGKGEGGLVEVWEGIGSCMETLLQSPSSSSHPPTRPPCAPSSCLPPPRWSVLSCMEALRHCDIETVGV